MRPKMSLVTLGTKDFERALAFYKDGLGWPTTATAADEVAFFDLGGVILALWPRELL